MMVLMQLGRQRRGAAAQAACWLGGGNDMLGQAWSDFRCSCTYAAANAGGGDCCQPAAQLCRSVSVCAYTLTCRAASATATATPGCGSGRVMRVRRSCVAVCHAMAHGLCTSVLAQLVINALWACIEVCVVICRLGWCPVKGAVSEEAECLPLSRLSRYVWP